MTTFNRVQRRRIGEILVDQGMVTKEDVDEALRIQKKTKETLGAILVDMGCITDMDITRTIVMQYQLPYIQLTNYQVSEKLVELFDVQYLHRHRIIPFDQVGDMLLCAVAEVPREEVLGEIPKTTQRNVALYVASTSDLEEHLEKLAPLPEELQRGRTDAGKKASQGKNAQGKPKKPGSQDAGDGKTQIFEEESSEAILQALDSTWDSIFESVDGQEEEDGESSGGNFLDDVE